MVVWCLIYLSIFVKLIFSTITTIFCVSDYVGCFPIPSQTPFLSNYGDMTVTLCRELCRGSLYTYAALSVPSDCFCFNSHPDETTRLPYRDCTVKCKGNAAQYCGGNTAAAIHFVGKFLICWLVSPVDNWSIWHLSRSMIIVPVVDML